MDKKFLYLILIFSLIINGVLFLELFVLDKKEGKKTTTKNDVLALHLKKDVNEGLEIYKLLCEEKDGASCFIVGMLYSEDMDTSSNYQKGKEYKKKSCEMGNMLGCYYYARHFIETDKEYHERGRYYKKACDKGNIAVSCNNYAVSLIKNTEKTEEALTYAKKACDLNGANGCFNAGKLLKERKDYKEAFQYFKKGCDMGSGTNCNAAAMLIDKKKDEVQGFELKESMNMYKRSCDLGCYRGCNNYATSMDDSNPEKKRIYEILSMIPEMAVYGYYNLACLYSKKGDKEKAITHVKKALAEKPDLAEVIAMDKDFENIVNLQEFKNAIKSAKCCMMNLN